MNYFKKRGAALFLALALCLSLLPGTALAANSNNGKTGHISTHGDAVDCEKCAQNDHWADNNGKAHAVHYCKCCGVEIQKDGKIWVAIEVEPAHEHSYSGEWAHVGTSKHAQVCDACGELSVAEAHEFVEEIVAEATCMAEGQATLVCECGCVIPQTIPAKGHTYAGGECVNCGEVDPDHEHAYTVLVSKTDATCTEDGAKVYQCELCEATYSIIYKTAGHDYSRYIATASSPATCVAEGVAVYKCTVCGDKECQTTPRLAHSTVRVQEVPATCESKGMRAYTLCTVCNEKFVSATSMIPVTDEELVIPATGHNWAWVDYGAWHYKSCVDCGVQEGDSEKHTYWDENWEMYAACPECGHVFEK